VACSPAIVIELPDLIRMVARQRWLASATLFAVMAATTGFLATQKNVYQSTETVQLSSADAAFLSQVNNLTPLYSALLTADQTLVIARSELAPQPLADIAVRTFTDSPLLKVDATAGSQDAAQRSAVADVNALSRRLSTGSKLGAPGIALAVVDGPTPPEMIWPRWALSLGVAALVGVLLGLGLAWPADVLRRGRMPVKDEQLLIPSFIPRPRAARGPHRGKDVPTFRPTPNQEVESRPPKG
jgi:hypothetical protein